VILEDIQPYLTAVSTGLSFATLGFLLNVVKTIRENAQDRINIQEERIKKTTEDQQRLEKWSEKEKALLKSELDQAKKDLDALLKGQGIDLASLALGRQISETAVEVRNEAQKLIEEMKSKLQKLSTIAPEREPRVDSSVELSIAMGSMASGEYEEAASHFDAYSAKGATSWETNYSRGVAHANTRNGEHSDRAALMAYNDAIALSPRDLDQKLRARLFGYRGAILKRLNRLEEAANDLRLALKLAPGGYETLDAHYNLACVSAMQGERGTMLEHIKALQKDDRFRRAVAYHFMDYFVRYRDDREFLELIAGDY
jgi:tetratricopeptide (TPR) repeat protein